MRLYKAVAVSKRKQYTDGWYFYAATIESALFWAHGLFGDRSRYFINEYKIPNDTPGLYNQESYRINPEFDIFRKRRQEDDKWAGGDGTNTLMPIGDMPKMSITSQIAIPDKFGPFEYRQVAYYDGEKLITKDAAAQAKANTQSSFSKAAHALDELDTLLRHQTIRHVGGYMNDLSDNSNNVKYEIEAVESYFEIASEYIAIIQDSLKDVLQSQDLTQHFALFVSNLKAYTSRFWVETKSLFSGLIDKMKKLESIDYDKVKSEIDILADKSNTMTRMMKQVNFITGKLV